MKIKNLKGKTILITGGAGFIGSHLCDKLLYLGAHVRCLDNLSTGDKENIQHLLDLKNFELIEGDIRDIKTCEKALINIDYILHQAALGSVPRSINDPITTNDVNINGFLNLIFLAQKFKIKKFVFAASSSTYGDSLTLPKVENKIGKPLSPYAVTKYVNELYAEIFHSIYDLDFIGLRYFNVFGPRQNLNGEYAAVIPKFIDCLIKGIQPTINGDGKNSRDFTYVDNIVHANIRSLISNSNNQIFNIAYGQRITLNELFNLIKKEVVLYFPEIKDLHPKYGPPRDGDVLHSLASIEKAKTLLGYEPLFSLKDGLKSTVKFYV